MSAEIENDNETPEHLVGEEAVEEPKYAEVYFGHEYAEVDRDQFLAREIIYLAGDIDPEAGYFFGTDIPQDAIDNPRSLILEGPIEADIEKGCYQHDPQDHTIAYQAFHHYSDRLKERLTPEEYSNLERFVTWIENVDSDQPRFAKDRKAAVEENLPLRGVAPGAITPLWEGIKLVHRDNPAEMLEKAHETFQLALKEGYNPNLNEPLSNFPDFEKYVDAQQEAKRAALEAYKREKGPQALVLKNGVSMALYDVRGIDAERGGLGAARRRAKKTIGETPHFVVLTAEGPEEGTRKILVSKSPDVPEDIEAFDVTAALGERLNRSERFSGLGWQRVEKSPAGGHRGVVGTSQEYGTALSSLEFALKVAFDRGMKTEEEMQEAAEQLANSLSESSQQHFDYSRVWEQPENPDFLPIQVVILSMRREDGGVELIKISEYEIDDEIGFIRENGRLMGREERNQQRTERALENFRYYLETDLDLALSYLNEIPAGSLNRLSVEERLTFLAQLSQSEEAIDQVYNPYRTRWRISEENLLDWERGDATHEMSARFKREALAYKVDTVLIGGLYQELSATPDRRLQEEYVNALVKILNSNSLRSIHGSREIFDNVSYHLALVAANREYVSPHISQVTAGEAGWESNSIENAREALVMRLTENEWTQLAMRYRGILSTLAVANPDRFERIDKQYRYEDRETLERKGLVIVEPDVEALKSLQPGEIATLYVDVGRDLTEHIGRVRTREGRVENFETNAGRFLYHTSTEDHEIAPLIRNIVALAEQSMISMPSDPSIRLRIVTGGMYMPVTDFKHVIAREFGKDADRIVYSSFRVTDYERGEGEFVDSVPPAEVA